MPPLEVVERYLGAWQDPLLVIFDNASAMRFHFRLDELNTRCDVFIPLGDDILVPLGNNEFFPFRYDTFLPLRDNIEVPLLLSAKEDWGGYFDSTVNIGFCTFDMRGNRGVGKHSLYRWDDVGVKYDALVLCQAATYRGLEVCILRTHGKCVDGKREEE